MKIFEAHPVNWKLQDTCRVPAAQLLDYAPGNILDSSH